MAVKALMPSITRNCANTARQMEKKAADAERSSVKYKQAEYLKDQVGEVFSGM
jgi:exoribonuclease R